jgi:hypothetical protein
MASHRSVLVVRRFNLHIEGGFMEVALTSRLLQLSYFIIIQPTSDYFLEFLLTNLLLGLFFLGRLEPRFEARLHANAKRGGEAYALCIAADLGAFCRRLVNGEEEVACGLEGEGRRVVGDGDGVEGLFRGDGSRVRAEDAVFVTAEVPMCC